MKLKIGDQISTKKEFSQEEVLSYARSSRDTNPVHYDIKYAEKTTFNKPIVHGLLVASLFGGLLGSKLPGKGTIHLGQTLRFAKPVYVGESVEAFIKVISIRQDKPVITFDTTCVKENGEIAITGEAVVIYRGPYYNE